jgi:hypothetical protein
MSGTMTMLNRVNNALNWLSDSQNGIWLGMGGYVNDWLDDINPPIPDPLLQEIPDLVGFVYIHQASLIANDNQGSIETDYGRYTAYDQTSQIDTLVNNLANKIYLSCLLDGSKLPSNLEYRIFGICSHLTFNQLPLPVMGLYIPSSEVLSYRLRWISTISKQTITNSTYKFLRFVIEV